MKLSINLILLLSLSYTLTSCSFFKSARRSIVDEDEAGSASNQTVSKKQYEELLSRYEELHRKYEMSKEGKDNSLSQNESSVAPVVSNTNVETVDVFNQGQASANTAVAAANIPNDLENQIELLKNARMNLLDSKKQTDALKSLQGLKNSKYSGIKARATYELGELFFKQSEFDLALQMYEEVITQNAGSGMVIEALPKIIVSCEKLGLPSKKEQYQTLMKDVFN